MAIGTVKWFNTAKKYGFIESQENGKDIFVHVTSLERAGLSDLSEGQKVSYELATNKGKVAAVNIKLLENV